MFLDEAWFWRGFQSAIFYYVSCAPCSKLSYRRKKRKEYKRAKAEKGLHETEEGLYQHPSPFSTNPYWREEMNVGPGPPARKAVRDGRGKPETGKQRKDRRSQTLGTQCSDATGVSSTDTEVGGEGTEQLRDSSEGWNKKRYQREDEILWGVEMQPSISMSSNSPPRSSPRGGPAYQYYARNPAINDLHPPVVSTQPRDRTEILWMLQPPPKAQVMAGKERASIANTPNRSRSTSGGSYGNKSAIKKSSDMSLGRQVGEKFMESKLRQGLLPESSVGMSRDSSTRSRISNLSAAAPGQPHDRDTTLLSHTRSNSSRRTKAPPPPISISKEPDLPSPPPERPPLSTIPSETLPQRPKDRPSRLRLPLSPRRSASSLHVLQELSSPSSQLNLMKTPSDPLPRDAVDVGLPPVSQEENHDLHLPELESWFPESGWDFPPKAVENASARSQHRWTTSI